MMRRLATCAAALLAAGCAHRIPPCPPCEPEVRVVEVLVPVPVPCHVQMIPPPVPTLPAVAPGDTRGTLEALLADLRAWRRAYEAQRTAAEACPPPTPTNTPIP